MKQPVFKEFVVRFPVTPIYPQQLMEGQQVTPTQIYFSEQRVYTINDKLTPMKEEDLNRVKGKRIHVLFITTEGRAIMTTYGKCYVNHGMVSIDGGWGNINPRDIIDWYFE